MRPDESDSDSEGVNNVSNEDRWPRFLVICPENEAQSLDKLSPFAVHKAIKGLAGEPKDVKVLRNGNILVECNKKQQSVNLQKSTIFANIPVKVTPHNTLNFSKGVVRSRELRNCSEHEMLEHLKDQNVTDVKRIHITKNGNKILTNTFVLQFDIPTVPPKIKAGFLSIPVEPFVPNPLRCFNCQRFGHHKDKCTKNAVCSNCGKEGHDNSSCENPKQCANCKGDHLASSRECPRWQQEREIQTLKVKEQISFKEARKRVEGRTPGGASYASVAAGPIMKSSDMQTYQHWDTESQEYVDLPESIVAPDKARESQSAQTSTADIPPPKTTKPIPQPNRPKPEKRFEPKLPKFMRNPVPTKNSFDALGEDMDVGAAAFIALPTSPKNKKKLENLKVKPPDKQKR